MKPNSVAWKTGSRRTTSAARGLLSTFVFTDLSVLSDHFCIEANFWFLFFPTLKWLSDRQERDREGETPPSLTHTHTCRD